MNNVIVTGTDDFSQLANYGPMAPIIIPGRKPEEQTVGIPLSAKDLFAQARPVEVQGPDRVETDAVGLQILSGQIDLRGGSDDRGQIDLVVPSKPDDHLQNTVLTGHDGREERAGKNRQDLFCSHRRMRLAAEDDDLHHLDKDFICLSGSISKPIQQASIMMPENSELPPLELTFVVERSENDVFPQGPDEPSI